MNYIPNKKSELTWFFNCFIFIYNKFNLTVRMEKGTIGKRGRCRSLPAKPVVKKNARCFFDHIRGYCNKGNLCKYRHRQDKSRIRYVEKPRVEENLD